MLWINHKKCLDEALLTLKMPRKSASEKMLSVYVIC